MISRLTNVSTGPVGITSQVQKALQEPPLSHRSAAFRNLYDQTTEFLNNSFHVRDSYLITGSGTLANEIMLQEIKNIGGKGLILSNGEFGNRLIAQAHRVGLDFLTYKEDWGTELNLSKVENILIDHSIKWMLYCQCETSTGMICDLKRLTTLASNNNCLSFVDCMSTVGTVSLDLSGVSMATASSGKGLASVPGLAIVFSNIEPGIKSTCPVYLDLFHFKKAAGIPFTIPSNLVKALNVSIRQKFHSEQFEMIANYRNSFFNILNESALVPFSNGQTSVFTIVPPESATHHFTSHLINKQLVVSHESDYLKDRSWCQLATFGYYTERQLKQISNALYFN
jgi:aspartate aminotransferase-like enzyme